MEGQNFLMINYETKKIQNMVLIALYTALVASVTVFTVIPFGAGGYFNLGDVAVMVIAAITPLRHAVFAASLGSMMADILSGYAHYAIFTGIIKGLMAVVVYLLLKKLKGKAVSLAFVAGSLVMLLLYGVVDAFLLGGYPSFVASISVNTTQAVIGCIVSMGLYPLTLKLRDFLKG